MFDGVNWHIYSVENSPLISNVVTDIIVGQDNAIWFATQDGLSRMREFPGEVILALDAEVGQDARVRLSVSCSNEIADLNADLFVWAELSDGTKLYLPRVSLEEGPMFTRLAIPNGFAVGDIEIWSAGLTHVPSGHYTIKALLTNHGCLVSPLSNEATAEFDWQFE